MRYRHVFTPTDYTTITPEMVKRWMAMEARLEERLAKANSVVPETFIDDDVKRGTIRLLQYIKAGSDGND